MLPIHQSLHRHSHVMGAEREPVMVSALLAMLVGVGGFSIISAVTALVFWITAIISLRAMAKSDPIMSKVWMRHIKQQAFYAAKTRVWRK
jgi:type IV secretion system protein VirB3/type IV secretion system protein VirB4